MKFDPKNKFRVFGNQDFRGKCPKEDSVHVAYVAWVRHKFPYLARYLIHMNNEGQRTPQQVAKAKAMGDMSTSMSDIHIMSSKHQTFVLEIKREDRLQSQWQDGQEEYLNNATDDGFWTCAALGLEACKEATIEWLNDCGELTESEYEQWRTSFKYHTPFKGVNL